MRLAKHLAHAGVASRRAAERMIADGRVAVDGEVVRDPARDVAGTEAITVDGRAVRARTQHVVYAVHKPPGVVSTARDTHGRPTVVDLVDDDARLYPVGRLDADTTGLILLTDDGDLAYRLTHPRFEVPKTYRARVSGGPLAPRALRALRTGVELDDGRTAPARVRQVGPHELELVLHEGRKRQVRRMCAAVGHPVLVLRRVGFGPLQLGRLAEGAHRRLTPAEVQRLRAAGEAAAGGGGGAAAGGGGGAAAGGGGGAAAGGGGEGPRRDGGAGGPAARAAGRSARSPGSAVTEQGRDSGAAATRRPAR